MKKESLGKARAISTSLAIILFMGLFCLMPAAGAKADQDLVPVTTATELKEAFAEARDGTTIRLQEDIFYDRYELGSIEVNRKVILDFAGYKLTTSNAPQNKNNIYALFGTIEPGASLTLIDAQLETDNRMGVVDTNYGTLIVESTYEGGIQTYPSVVNSDNCLSHHNYGHLEIVSGQFDLETVVYKNYGSVRVQDAQVKTKKSFIYQNTGYARIMAGTWENQGHNFVSSNSHLVIDGGSFDVKGNFLGSHYGMLDIRAGDYQVGESLVNSNRNTMLIWDGDFKVGGHLSKLSTYNEAVQVRIKGGSFEVGSLPAIEGRASSLLFISGGSFQAGSGVEGSFFHLNGSRVRLSGGDFTCSEGTPVFQIEGDEPPTVVTFEEGFEADRPDWLEASHVEVRPHSANVRFMVEGQEMSRLEGRSVDLILPQDPPSAEDSPFICWLDEEGLPVFDLRSLVGDRVLTARFLEAGDLRVDSNEALAQAIEDLSPLIVITEDIELTESMELGHNCLVVGLGFPVLSRTGDLDEGECLVAIYSEHSTDTEGSLRPDVHVTVTLMDLILDGEGIPAICPGIWINPATTMNLSGVTIRNNICKDDYGGAISNEGELRLFAGSSIESNRTHGSGGGIYNAGWLYMYEGSRVSGNQAQDGGGVYSALYALDHLLWYEENGFVMYGGEISGNQAQGRGGGVCLADALFWMEDGRIVNNQAEDDGGGVGGRPGLDQDAIWAGYLEMNDGVIAGNQARRGGGIGSELDGVVSGGVYGNRASVEGDDIRYPGSNNPDHIKARSTLLVTGQPGPRPYLSLPFSDPDFVSPYQVDLIEGVPEPDGVLIPFVGWYADGGTFRGQEADRFETAVTSQGWPPGEDLAWWSTQVPDIYAFGLPHAAKSLWQGQLVFYDANFEGGVSNYDPSAYLPGASARVLDNSSLRPGYRFKGWNTDREGQGQCWQPGDSMEMKGSLILYAQWEEAVGSLRVTQQVSGNQADKHRSFDLVVTLDDPAIEGVYGDMTFVGGMARFSLKSGQEAVATGLPAGLGVRVQVTGTGDYQVEVNGRTADSHEGEIETGGLLEMRFLNTLEGADPGGPPEEVGGATTEPGTKEPAGKGPEQVPATGSSIWFYPLAGMVMLTWGLGLVLLVRKRAF